MMRQAWGEFLQAGKPGSHGAHVYAEPSELAESVVAFLAAGFERGEPALLVAAPEHLPAFSDGLAETGWDVAGLQESGRLAVVDAEATLAAVTDEGAPSPERFDDAIGRLLDALAPTGGRVRIFGEMVDVLCRRGDAAGAAALERLWNALATQREFSLLCGYRLDVFDEAAQVRTLPHVCREHSHVLPVRNYPRFARAVDDALREVLGPSDAAGIYVRVSREADDGHLPLAQLLLMWVTRNLPRQSGRILDAARLHYARAA